jgi:microcystin-dependent protein
MSEFFIGQIMLTGFNFAPKFWAQCNGQLLPINQNQALFSLLGTQFGGNGTTNFALPDLRSRTPIGYASSVDPAWQPAAVQIGQASGVENVSLSTSTLPAHTHTVSGSSVRATSPDPTGRTFAVRRTGTGYAATSNSAAAVGAVTPHGGGSSPQPHPNMQPYTVVNFAIALSGIFPSRN